MLEIIFYLCTGGCISAFMIVGFILLLRPSEAEKQEAIERRELLESLGMLRKKRKKKRPPSRARRILKRCTVILLVAGVLICLGPIFSWLAVATATDLIHEHKTIDMLEEKGQIQTVPLNRVFREDAGRNTIYHAEYQYGGATHDQTVTKDQYNRLRGKDSVDIMVYGDSVRIVGSKPKYDLIVLAMLTGTVGVMVIGITLYGIFGWLRNTWLDRVSSKRSQ